MLFVVALIACWGIVSATVAGHPTGPNESQRIIGGSATTNYQYIFTAALLFSQSETTFTQQCGGSILNQRTILTVAHCFWNTGMVATRWRARVGSSWANSGGYTHLSAQIFNHPQYNPNYNDVDFSLLRLSSLIQYVSGSVGPGSIAGPNYKLAGDEVVWAIGWGEIWPGGSSSDQLRHVQIWIINQEICEHLYASQGRVITNSMLCAIGPGRSQCTGDDGSPLLHNNVIVGIYSWAFGCADPHFPGVNSRISYASNWIQAMA